MPTFDKYIAIDWSGAKGNRQKGIAVAIYKNNTLKIHNPPNGATNWARTEIYTLIEDEIKGKIKGNRKTLIGIDFAFAFPWCDINSYFFNSIYFIHGYYELWSIVNGICIPDKNFYGGAFQENDIYKHYYNSTSIYCQHRYRLTELNALYNNSVPSSIFNKDARQKDVSKSTLSGIRLLYYLLNKYSNNINIWPFHYNPKNNITLVEIYPAFYLSRFFLKNISFDNKDNNEENKKEFKKEVDGFIYNRKLPNIKNNHERDAILSVLAIERLSKDRYTWHPPNMTECARKYEGWIFGVL